MTAMATPGSRPLLALLVAAGLGGCVGGCAGPAPQAPQPATPPPAAPAVPASIGTAVVAGAIPADRVAAVLDALQADLAGRLKPDAGRGVIVVSRRADGAPRVTIDVAQSFEAGSAQMRAETLLRIAECATAAQTAAVVVHVIGSGEPAATADGESLAERRAASVAAYLQERGLPASRVRAEGRVTRDRDAVRRLELVFEPIVEGREVRAWMPPTAPAAVK